MKILKAVLAATALLSVANSAQAQDRGAYGTIGLQAYFLDAENAINDVTNNAVGDGDANLADDYGSTYINVAARLGYTFHDNFSVEVEGAFGLSGQSKTYDVTDEIDITGVSGEAKIETKIKNSIAPFLVAHTPVSDKVDLFGRVGYSYTSAKIKGKATITDGVDSFSESGSDTGSTYGLVFGTGLIYNLDDQNGVRAGYTYSTGSDDLSANIFDISYVRKF